MFSLPFVMFCSPPLCPLYDTSSPDAELVMWIAGRILVLHGADEDHAGDLILVTPTSFSPGLIGNRERQF